MEIIDAFDLMNSFSAAYASEQFHLYLTEDKNSRMVALHKSYWDNKDSKESSTTLFADGSITVQDPLDDRQFKFFVRQEHLELRDLIERSSKDTTDQYGLRGAFLGGQPGMGT